MAPLTGDELAGAAALDRENFGADRSGLLRSLMEQSPDNAWILKRSGRVGGFIVRGPMSWLLQARNVDDMAALIRWADGHSGQGSYPVLIREEHAKQLPGKCDVHFLLTAMQLGNSVSPHAAFGSMLPDIG